MNEFTNKTKVAVVGAGAVGSYYGARLAQAGVDVTFLLRSDYKHVSRHGLKITSVHGDFELPEPKCEQRSQDIGPVDLVIIAWKTTSNNYYEEVIRPLLHDGTKILTLQNGLGSTEQLAQLFGVERIYGGLCFVCINRLSPGCICHSASGLVRVGAYLPSKDGGVTGRLVSFLEQGGVLCEAVENLEHAQWMKLVWNIPFNGLAIAEGGVDTDVLLASDGLEDRIRRIMHEVQAVAEALGYKISDRFIESQISVTRKMKAYRPSSMIDYVEGREVEVGAIWREPLRIAVEMGVPVPEIEGLLRGIEERLKRRIIPNLNSKL